MFYISYLFWSVESKSGSLQRDFTAFKLEYIYLILRLPAPDEEAVTRSISLPVPFLDLCGTAHARILTAIPV